MFGRAFKDSKGKWYVGNCINVPVKSEMKAARSSIMELKDEFLKLGNKERIKKQACDVFNNLFFFFSRKVLYLIQSFKIMTKDIF